MKGKNKMILISQDKKAIINFEKINYIQLQPNEYEVDIEISYADNEFADIGTYDNEERAAEVLMEIVTEYKKVARVEAEGRNKPIFYNIPKAYIMPEK